MNLKEIAEIAFRQLFPNPGDETSLTREDFLSTAKSEYALQIWQKAKAEKREEGYWNVPSNLLAEVKKEVVDNEMDISDLQILKSIPDEKWLANIGGLTCSCEYIKSNVNQSQLLCDEDLGDGIRTFYVIGNKIKFPKGTHDKTLPIIYASSGLGIKDEIDVDDVVAGMIRTRLIEIYAGKVAKEDVTNNTSSII